MKITSKPGIYITGIGIPLLPNSLLDVKIFIHDEFGDYLIHEGRLNSSGNKDTEIEPINFQNPIKIPDSNTIRDITIEIKGHGALRFGCRKLENLKMTGSGWMTYSMNYQRKNGIVTKMEVSIIEDKEILAELYIKPLDKRML